MNRTIKFKRADHKRAWHSDSCGSICRNGFTSWFHVPKHVNEIEVFLTQPGYGYLEGFQSPIKRENFIPIRIAHESLAAFISRLDGLYEYTRFEEEFYDTLVSESSQFSGIVLMAVTYEE
jgi:hypothetical protein